MTIRLQRWSMRHLGNALRLAMLKAACAIGAILFVVLAIDAVGGPGAGLVAALAIGFVIGWYSSA